MSSLVCHFKKCLFIQISLILKYRHLLEKKMALDPVLLLLSFIIYFFFNLVENLKRNILIKIRKKCCPHLEKTKYKFNLKALNTCKRGKTEIYWNRAKMLIWSKMIIQKDFWLESRYFLNSRLKFRQHQHKFQKQKFNIT